MSSIEPFHVSRVFDAPRAIVFLAHTDAAQLSRWGGPAGTTVIHTDLDLKPGGVHHYGLRYPDGSEVWGKQRFLEIESPQKIVQIQSFSDAQGGLVRHPLSPAWPLSMHATTTFREVGPGRTEIEITWRPHEANDEETRTFDQAREGMTEGWKGAFDKLEAYLAESQREIFQSKRIDAPRERVWKALIDPAQVNAWWGPDGFRNTDVTQDVRIGGQWKFNMIGPDGTVYPNLSTYVEITENRRLVYDCGDGNSVMFRGVVDLQEIGGKTLVTLSVTAPSKEARDGFLAFHAIDGGQQTLSKLAAFVG